MGIYFPGMMMPTECWECPCAYETEGAHHNYCQAVGYDTQLPDEGRPDWCPLIELPPHGRLIDADAMAKKDYDDFTEIMAMTDPATVFGTAIADAHAAIQEFLKSAPTIIPADEEANNV